MFTSQVDICLYWIRTIIYDCENLETVLGEYFVCRNLCLIVDFIKGPRSSVFIVKFELFTYFDLLFQSVIDFEQVNAGWVIS